MAYLLNLLELPTVPIVLGLILGPTAEFYLRNALSIGNGNRMIFFQRSICIAFIVLLVLLSRGRAEAARSENILALLTGPRILICKNDRLSAVIFAVLHWAIYIYSIAALRLCAPPGQSFSSGA